MDNTTLPKSNATPAPQPADDVRRLLLALGDLRTRGELIDLVDDPALQLKFYRLVGALDRHVLSAGSTQP